ncbi:MAG: hypothetical protein ACJ72H_09285 [Candidatus Sulfotelmatobacter sp.]|jgi:hypothetical protein
MRMRLCFMLFVAFLLAGCNSTSKVASAAPEATTRTYRGTASVGDFLTVIINPSALTLTYTNHSNGDTGTIPYSVNSDGTYTLSDPQANLIAAYEVANYAMLIQAAKTGPTHDTPALITAVNSTDIALSTFSGQAYNYMQFRTRAGGVQIGAISIDAQGIASTAAFWPSGLYFQGGTAFGSGTMDMSLAELDSSRDFLKLTDQGDSSLYDYVFGTANGIFAVDSPNGAILGLKKASSKDFDPSFAGTYQTISYQKNGATMGSNNSELGTPSLAQATISVSAAGVFTVTDEQGRTPTTGTLTPVADASYLYGSGKLADPCYGLFTYRITGPTSQQDVFVTFMGRAMLFSSFTGSTVQSGLYDYVYGVGLK